MLSINFTAKVWLYNGHSAWHFISLPKTLSAKIKKLFLGLERGWGSLPVKVTIGESEWRTSIFPDTKTKSYLLPLKAGIRKKENLKVGDKVKVSLEIIA
jgi:hypothetical protein